MLIAAAIVLGLALLRRLRDAQTPAVAQTTYPEAVALVSALVGARSRERVAEELLELMTRSLQLKRLVFFVPEHARPSRKLRVGGEEAGGKSENPRSSPKGPRLVVLTSRGIPPSEAETLAIDLTSESAPGTAARERRPVARETTQQGAFSFGMAYPIVAAEQLLGVVASSDIDAALVQMHHGDLVRQLCSLAGMALSKLEAFERTTEAAEEEHRQRERTYEMLAAYVSPSVAQELIAHPEMLSREAEPAEVTVLFADIQGFTSLCESADAGDVVRKLNAYLTVMADIIMKFNGTVDKFVGDQIVAYWNRPVAQPEHAMLAARAALEMRESQRRLRREWVAGGQAALKMGIALNSGAVVFGHIGSSRKKDLTVIGDTVNTCARLEKLTRVYGVDVIIGEKTHALLGARAQMRMLGEQRVKGREETVKVYALDGIPEASQIGL